MAQSDSAVPNSTLTPLAAPSSQEKEKGRTEKQGSRSPLQHENQCGNLPAQTPSPWAADAAAIKEIRAQLERSSNNRLSDILGDTEQFNEELEKLMSQEYQIESRSIELQPNPRVSPQPSTGRLYPLDRLEQVRPLQPLETASLKTASLEPVGFNSLEIPSQMTSVVQPLLPIRESLSRPNRLKELRESARRLESSAAELEELELFDEADQLRKIALDIWKKARIEIAVGNSSN